MRHRKQGDHDRDPAVHTERGGQVPTGPVDLGRGDDVGCSHERYDRRQAEPYVG